MPNEHNGLKHPAPTGYVPEEWELDPKTRQLRMRSGFVPPHSPGWWKRNWTLGNIVTILSVIGGVILATALYVQSARVADVQLTDRVADVEHRLTVRESIGVNRDAVTAQFDGLTKQLEGMDKRLDSIDKRLGNLEARR